MPIYEYTCEGGHDVEVLQAMAEPPLVQCPVCSQQCRRTVSAFNQVRGAGIYVFDRRFSGRDILHDATFSDRDRAQILSRKPESPHHRRRS
jgi:putative FmdB family regulatory protein